MRRRAAAVLVALAGTAAAQVAPPEGGRIALEEASPLDALRVATGPFDGTLPAVAAEGALTRRVWQVPGGASSLALIAPVRDALVASGWEVALDCAARGCGGFEFRFEIEVAPAPTMFVDLADYRYLSARRGGAWTVAVASVSAGIGYLEVTEVAPGDALAPAGPDAVPPGAAIGAPVAIPPPPPPGDLGAALEAVGHAPLPDVAFASGSAELEGGDLASLAALAAYLQARAEVTVALVGHTDATGGSAGNLAISRRRAEAVRDRLIRRHGVAPDRLEAAGVGYYAPVASSGDEAGRRANRRVEAVVTSTR